jgi:hypothetical protein
MRRIALTLIPLFFVACSGEPTAPNPGRLTASRALMRSVPAAPAANTEFDGFINFCQAGDPTGFRVTPGGTVHFGVSNENRWVTGNPLIDGVEHNTGRAIINPHGQLIANLDNSLKPDAVNGTWEIEQHLRVGDGVSTGVGHGTGDLLGMTIKFTTDPIAGRESVCNPDALSARVYGVILSPAS